MALRLVLGSIHEQFQAAVQKPEQFVGRQHPRMRGGELDGKRQAVEPTADLADHARRGRRQLEVGQDRLGALDEQADRIRCPDLVGSDGRRARRAERWRPADVLACQMQPTGLLRAPAAHGTG